MCDYDNAKMEVEARGNQAISMGLANQCGTTRPQPVHEARKRADHHYSEANKAQRAAEFLSAHPEFGEFIELIRSGALSI